MTDGNVTLEEVEALYEQAEAAGVHDAFLAGAQNRYIKTGGSMAFVTWLCVELIELRKQVAQDRKEEGL